jgi:hypothetical protein
MTLNCFYLSAQSNRDTIRIQDADKWQDSTNKNLNIYQKDSVAPGKEITPDTLKNPFRKIEKDSTMHKNKTTTDTIRLRI